jgi:glucose dehydrogenase
MRWLKIVAAVLLALLGLVWLGQGLNLIKGSFMTGRPEWAVAGLVLLAIAAWLAWTMARASNVSPR